MPNEIVCYTLLSKDLLFTVQVATSHQHQQTLRRMLRLITETVISNNLTPSYRTFYSSLHAPRRPPLPPMYSTSSLPHHIHTFAAPKNGRSKHSSGNKSLRMQAKIELNSFSYKNFTPPFLKRKFLSCHRK